MAGVPGVNNLRVTFHVPGQAVGTDGLLRCGQAPALRYTRGPSQVHARSRRQAYDSSNQVPGRPARTAPAPAGPPPRPWAPAPPRPTGPRGNPRVTGRTHRDARSTQRLMSSWNTSLTRPVRGRPWKADGSADRPSGPDAVRYMSVDTAIQGPTVLQGDTWRDKTETAPIS